MKEPLGLVNAVQISQLNYFNLAHQFKTEDIYALSLLQPLLADYPLLPFTGSSLRPFCLTHIINDIIINSRKNIIEFGSGISTILIGRLIKKNNLTTTLISIDSNEKWVKALTELLKTEKIDDVVNVQYAPLKKCSIALKNNLWYDLKAIKKYYNNKKFDMVIVDGPEAWEAGKELARYPAIPFIANKLEKNFSLYLDDAMRPGEQKIIKIWESEYGIRFNISGKSLAYYYRGNSFHTEPFGYYFTI